MEWIGGVVVGGERTPITYAALTEAARPMARMRAEVNFMLFRGGLNVLEMGKV